MLLYQGSVLEPISEFRPIRGLKDDGFTSTADTSKLLEVLAGPNAIGPIMGRSFMERRCIPISDRPDQDDLTDERDTSLASPRMSNSVTSSGIAEQLAINNHSSTTLFPSIVDTNIQR